jgi:Cellulose binding domain
MASAGRRRLASHRRSSGPAIRRRPFGAPCQHWWLDEQALQSWPHDQAPQSGPDEPCQHWWLGEPAHRPWSDLPGWRRWLDAAARRQWLAAATRHPWYVAFSVGAGFMALASGVIFIVPGQSPRAMVTGCGLVPCGAAVRPPAITFPGPAATPSPSAAPRTSQPARPAATATPAPPSGPAAVPSAMASATPEPAPKVSVSYTLVAQWSAGLMGALTIANDGGVSITGWEVSAEFPGDQVHVIVNSGELQSSGDDLTVGTAAGLPAIAAGTSETVYFVAEGNTSAPAACTFNGYACGP